ncbi:hypothetical protein IP510_04810 [Psychrobacter sp. NG254]|uniref:hypothetical protein n=1 Tax=Psychrobacter sp. NG254 TaxID=2782003 RepID=UPI001887F9D6|nr:hypothetical protein [Psychrobacter sp. NG254]MBF2719201.1 hypothetical protein [Psychrobacter sp. NG254]
MATKNTTYKNWLTVGLVAAALTLSACGKKDETPMEAETDTTVDAQTSVEENATATSSDDVAVASADDEGMDVTNNDDVAVATADDAEVMDGTGDSEHVSTY